MSKNYPGKDEMLELFKKRGINDEAILKSFLKIKREDFLSDFFKIRAYEDCALPIGQEQTISQPFTVAIMTSVLKVKRNSKILEIGTGSGYQSVILNDLGAKVFTIERNLDLHTRAKEYFSKNNLPIISKFGDGTLGWKEYSPFDGIIVTAGAPIIPESLKSQLAIGGRLVIPVGNKAEQNLLIITRNENNFTNEEIRGFKFVPLIGKDGWEK